MKRAFIGVKATPALQAEVLAWRESHRDLDVRWVSPENLHVTLVPPWEEGHIHAAVRSLHEAVDHIPSFSTSFTSVGYGPHSHTPRLIWAEGIRVPAIEELADKLNAEFGSSNNSNNEQFRPHITLARFDTKPAEELFEAVNWPLLVDNVTLFESHPGSEYSVVERIELA